MSDVQPVEEAPEQTDDKKKIEQEEREQMLNVANKSEVVEANPDDKTEGGKIDTKEGREVKPKKIPIGGIQMPGFFTRSKSKEKCKDENEQRDVEGNELLDENAPSTNAPIQTRIKLPNPFRKSKVDEDDKTEGNKDKKKLLDTIRLPLVSVFPRKKKDVEQNLENQAGLASMETLGDNDKSADKSQDDLKNVSLDEKKDLEKSETIEELSWTHKLKAYRVAISALLFFILITIIVIALAIPGRKPPTTSPVKNGKYVEAVTTCGRVEGVLDDSAVAFRGIPYARSPVGSNRFKYAQPLNSIDFCWNGTLLAHNSTDTCLQIYGNGSTSGVEDCLTLDVVTPYVRYENPLPVIVLIGADSLIGGSPGKMRPSARYARSRDVVFVRPNFRLGVLGFLALELLSKNDYPHVSGNYGLSDILEALKWVQLNIEHFGGDPKAVTLFGHRAGATLVTALTTIKNADKYFTRAWATSGGAIYTNKSLNESETDNKSFLTNVQCDNVGCLLEKDPEFLTNSIEDVWRKPSLDLPLPDEIPEKRHEWLVLDGKILQQHPANVWTNSPLPVKLVLGTTAHSGASQKLLMKHMEWTEDLVKEHLNKSVLSKKNLTKEVLEKYPLNYKGLSSMISDIRIICPLLAISTQMQKVPFYVVTQTRGEENIADIDSDVDAIFGRYEPKTPEQRRYVSAMQQLFYHYVWHGEVKQMEELGQKVLIVGQDVLPAANYSHCAFWINNNIVLPYAALD